jgi:hypothetical protein
MIPQTKPSKCYLTPEAIDILNRLDLESLKPTDRIAFAYFKGDKEKLV